MNFKKGFMATSLIYSFFLVFLMLMVSILASGVSNRVFISAIQKDIRSSLEGEQGFIVDTLPNTYQEGDEVSFAGETWIVLVKKTSSMVLILKESLSKSTIIKNVTREEAKDDTKKALYYGNCDDNACQVRGCRDVPIFNINDGGGVLNVYDPSTCYYDSRNPSQYHEPTWYPIENGDYNIFQITSGRYGQTIVSDIVMNWFQSHIGLQRVKEEGKLVAQTFQDGDFSYPQSLNGYTQEPFYIRLPLASEASHIQPSGVGQLKPFHVHKNSNSPTEITIYNASGAIQNVLSTTPAYIRPVIEVKG